MCVLKGHLHLSKRNHESEIYLPKQEIMKVKFISPKQEIMKVKQFQLISQVYCVGGDGLRCTQTTNGTGVKQREKSNNSL